MFLFKKKKRHCNTVRRLEREAFAKKNEDRAVAPILVFGIFYSCSMLAL